MSRFIKKLLNIQLFNRHAEVLADIEAGSNLDMDEWRGWDAWVDVKK
ncbi:MAG: hypothetical protein KKA29_07520 [Gammaproteobacteria bacterium]|nr:MULTISPECIES: hypothetical protein [unclassified Marinomonas]MBU2022149.1 hypothetical protein [Gammaproteobacteria bacterium]